MSTTAAGVLAREALAANGVEIDEAAMRRGLAALRWPGRIEVRRQRPLVIADSAHNRDSARALAQTVREELGCSEMTLVVGCSSDKDIEALAGELAPLASQVIATRSRHPRAMDPRDVADVLAARELPATVCEPVGAAVDAAQAQGDAVLVIGPPFFPAGRRARQLSPSEMRWIKISRRFLSMACSCSSRFHAPASCCCWPATIPSTSKTGADGPPREAGRLPTGLCSRRRPR